MSEKKFCKSCEYYYSEMFTCPICYGEQRERERIIKLIERRICFDALDDPDGRCNHHGGKCYDLRELINNLTKGQ